jgi:hypothetical protein
MPLPTHKHRAHNRDIHALSGIRTHEPNLRTREDGSCLRQRGHCDRLLIALSCVIRCFYDRDVKITVFWDVTLVFRHIFFLWLYSPILGLSRLYKTFPFISVTRSRTVCRTLWTGDQLVARPLLSAPGECDDDEVGGMNCFRRRNQSTRRKPAPTPLCPPQIPLARPGREPAPPRWEASD